jgi:hypothetical protein
MTVRPHIADAEKSKIVQKDLAIMWSSMAGSLTKQDFLQDFPEQGPSKSALTLLFGASKSSPAFEAIVKQETGIAVSVNGFHIPKDFASGSSCTPAP